jgi:exo-beta-1,3-glucanase (GH17 family)
MGDGRVDGGNGTPSDDQPPATGSYPTARNGDVLLGNPDYPAISYGAFRTTERTEENVPSVAELKEDLRLMEAMGIKLLRTYNTQGFSDTANLLVAIDELMNEDPDFEMYVMLGVWIDALNSWTGQPIVPTENNPANYAERAKAVEMVQAYPDIIKVIAVGNEAMVHWAPYHVAPEIILEHVEHLQDLKAAGDIPADVWITSSDNWASWSGAGAYDNPQLDELAEAVDFVSVHTYPFHDTHYNNAFWRVPEDEQGLDRMQQVDLAMERAADYAKGQVQVVRDYLNRQEQAKQIHVGETGWSSYTNVLYGDAGSRAADEYKQKAFFDAMRSWSDEYGASLFYFQAFDEPWKGDARNPGDSEKHFGLIDIDGNAKYPIWDLVDEGVFEGLTRGGVPITKSHDGDEQEVLDSVLAPPPSP